MFSFLIGQTNFLDENTSLSTTVTFPKIQTSDYAQPPRIGRTGDFHTPELLGSFTSPSGLTAMDVAWDGTYYYVSHGGNTDNVYRYDEQFNQVDYQFVNIDSRGIVQHPVDGKLYMKNYYGEEFYRLNTEPFDGTAEFLFYLSGNYSQDMFTFSADGQYIFTHQNGLIKKYDFSTGELVESLTLDNGGTGGNGIAHTGQYLITCGGYDRLNAHNEQGNYIGEIVFPNQVYSNYGTPSYANGLCFTNTNDWFAWDIDDGMVTTLAGCTDLIMLICREL